MKWRMLECCPWAIFASSQAGPETMPQRKKRGCVPRCAWTSAQRSGATRPEKGRINGVARRGFPRAQSWRRVVQCRVANPTILFQERRRNVNWHIIWRRSVALSVSLQRLIGIPRNSRSTLSLQMRFVLKMSDLVLFRGVCSPTSWPRRPTTTMSKYVAVELNVTTGTTLLTPGVCLSRQF